MAIATLNDLLVLELMNISDAEQQAAEAMSAQIEEVDDEDIEELLEARLESGQRLKREVDGALKRLGGDAMGARNEAARGIIQALEKVIEQAQTPELRMAILIAGVQKLEHYCIATWGSVKAFASEAGEQELVDIMQRALDEGYELDDQLTEIAQQGVSADAAEAGSEEGQPEDAEAADGSADGARSARSGGDDLAAREYKDAQGRVHHHTKSSMEKKA